METVLGNILCLNVTKMKHASYLSDFVHKIVFPLSRKNGELWVISREVN